jgi:hypothetical protein
MMEQAPASPRAVGIENGYPAPHLFKFDEVMQPKSGSWVVIRLLLDDSLWAHCRPQFLTKRGKWKNEDRECRRNEPR